ncbi:MAG: AMP-dependent synthetase [Gemmatimonadales bacterium]|nr:MAG: AMP-dependent synthetase [Gemmatimonadales bacterium]
MDTGAFRPYDTPSDPPEGTRMSKFVWTPNRVLVEQANVTRFMKRHGFSDAFALAREAAEHPEWFWEVVVEDLGISFSVPYSRVMDTSRGLPWTEWYVGGRINLAANCIDRHTGGSSADRVCLISESEDGTVVSYTFRELADLVDRCAAGLRALGVGKGDRVAAYMPMAPEVVVQMFAAIKIGAIFIPIFSGFAPPAVAERLQDAGAKVLFTADGTIRRGEFLDIKSNADVAAREVPSLERVVVVRRTARPLLWHEGRDVLWEHFLAPPGSAAEAAEMGAMDPALILYTSGTTGRPKGTVHSHAGTLVKIAQEVGHAFDMKPEDRFFWLTDIGWMMGPWTMIGGLFHGACVVLYDGAIDRPGPDRLWDIVERHKVTVLGLSPTAIRMAMRAGEENVMRHDLSSLRILGSTGEPWDEASWRWYFQVVGKGRCPIINISGGTDIIGCFLSPLPIHPLKPCTLVGPALGMAVDVWDEAGRPVRGQVGYLVATKPAPSMTRGLWNDPQRYLETYWSRWPDVWNHGDWAYIDEDGYWFLQGRADDTLKVAGRRIGPAEIEGALIATGKVSEAAAVGVPHEIKGEAIVCFVVLRPGYQPSEDLRLELADAVVKRVGKIDRPEKILFVSDLPKTRSAKILRRVVRAAYLGETDLGDLSTLQNPEAIEAILRAI